MTLFKTLKKIVSNAQEKNKQAQFEKLLTDDRAMVNVFDKHLSPKDMETQIRLLELISQGKIEQVKVELEKIYLQLGIQTYADKLKALEGFRDKKYEETEKGFEKEREGIKASGNKEALTLIDKKISNYFARKSTLALALSVSSFKLMDKRTRDYMRQADEATKKAMSKADKQLKDVDKMNQQMEKMFKGLDDR